MKEFWNERYASDHFVYGKNPNRFLAASLQEIPPGRILFPGEGEGRNAIYAASLGWTVDAFDQSETALEKGKILMEEKGFNFNYYLSGIDDFAFEREAYDAVGLVFFHTDPGYRKLLHQRVQESLKPGGILILEGFHMDQLEYKSGGPPVQEMLFDRDILMDDFSNLEPSLLDVTTTVLDEGPFHQGEARVIRFLGVKR
jgi:2-polyprenyl-3-methyl-5-hydroxy-6-metoxy-1,4-benzoquinol methylase